MDGKIKKNSQVVVKQLFLFMPTPQSSRSPCKPKFKGLRREREPVVGRMPDVHPLLQLHVELCQDGGHHALHHPPAQVGSDAAAAARLEGQDLGGHVRRPEEAGLVKDLRAVPGGGVAVDGPVQRQQHGAPWYQVLAHLPIYSLVIFLYCYVYE